MGGGCEQQHLAAALPSSHLDRRPALSALRSAFVVRAVHSAVTAAASTDSAVVVRRLARRQEPSLPDGTAKPRLGHGGHGKCDKETRQHITDSRC